jgi:hypothetical protein
MDSEPVHVTKLRAVYDDARTTDVHPAFKLLEEQPALLRIEGLGQLDD